MLKFICRAGALSGCLLSTMCFGQTAPLNSPAFTGVPTINGAPIHLTFEDLIATAAPQADPLDDGKKINGQILARFGTVSSSQSQQWVEIEATAGRSYLFKTPVNILQNRIRFVGHGATINCENSNGFVIGQAGLSNPNVEGSISGFRFNSCTIGIKTTSAVFWNITNNTFYLNGTCIDFNGISSNLSNNYCRGQLDSTPTGTVVGTGIIVRSVTNSANPLTPDESTANVISRNRVYLTAGNCIRLIDGGGHNLEGNDCEVNEQGEILIDNAFGNIISNLYAEPKPSSPYIVKIQQILGTPANQTAQTIKRRPESNRIIGGTFGGGALFDIDALTGNNIFIAGVRYGTGNLRFGAGINNGQLLPGAGTPNVTNGSGQFLVDLSQPGSWKGVRTSATSVPVNNVPGFVDFSGTETFKTLTLPVPENDAGYQIGLTAVVVAGTPTPGAVRLYVCQFPTTTTVKICNQEAPGAGVTVRAQYRIYR
jgi:hypothetical protein